MTLSAFMGDIEWISLPMPAENTVYPGFCAYCRFNSAAYNDALYDHVAVPLSPELARSVPKRRAEFLAGRYLARHVLDKLGIADFTLNSAQDRSPLWPANVCGSLSHNKDSVLCAVHYRDMAFGGVGVDVESVMSEERANSLWPGIVDEAECHWLRSLEMLFSEALTLNFSAKESLFKALYPAVQHYFDFLDARMTHLDQEKQVFELQLQTTLTPTFSAGSRFCGTYQKKADKVTTFICCQC